MEINYRIDGNGSKTLFFIHGWASDKSVWQNQIEAFKKDFRIINVDLRGHGETPWAETHDLLGSFTDDILELCDKLKLENINFVAWSMAGFVLLELCQRAAQLIDSFTLVTATPKFLNYQDYRCGTDEANLNLLKKKLNANLPAALEEFRLYMFSDQEKQDSRFAQAWEVLKKIPSPNERALTLGLELLEKADFRQDLNLIYKPTLLIAGEKDAIIPKLTAEFMQQRIKNAELVIFKDSGHAPFLTQPERFNQVLREWISKK